VQAINPAAFVTIVGVCVLAAWAGWRCASTGRRGVRCVLLIAGPLMFGWLWLLQRPTVAIELLPVALLPYLEGTAAAPMFMLILGVAWAHSKTRRQRRLVLLAAGVGAFYLLQGGLWMLQPTPAPVLGQERETGLVRQSQSYACVPAACATLLNFHGMPTSEAEMADLTHTRAGAGSTMIRALAGLRARLHAHPLQPSLHQLSLDELRHIDRPLLATIRGGPTFSHMVVIHRVFRDSVLIADPADGWLLLSQDEFETMWTGPVLSLQEEKL